MKNQEGRLKGKVAMVTGAGSGIGQASAILFAQQGAKVVVSDFNEKMGQATCDTITKEGGQAIFAKADVSKSAEVQALMASCVKAYGTLDALLNCAGVALVGKDGPVTEMSEETWNTTIAVNLTGTFLCCKYAIPLMLKKKSGSVINMSSMAGLIGVPNHGYSATKGGIISLTRSIAVVYAPHNVRANSICPGVIETAMTQPIRSDEQWNKMVISVTPLGRWGKAIDVANLSLFLASDESSYITGTNISIDGGRVSA